MNFGFKILDNRRANLNYQINLWKKMRIANILLNKYPLILLNLPWLLRFKRSINMKLLDKFLQPQESFWFLDLNSNWIRYVWSSIFKISWWAASNILVAVNLSQKIAMRMKIFTVMMMIWILIEAGKILREKLVIVLQGKILGNNFNRNL